MGGGGSTASASNAVEQVANYFTNHMAQTVNQQMSESILTVNQNISSSQKQVGFTVSLPPKGYCPAHALPRNLVMIQRNDGAAAVAFSAQALRPEALMKNLLTGLESATSGSVDRTRPGMLNFTGPSVTQRITFSEETKRMVSNALAVKLGSYVTSNIVNNQEQININIVMPCGNVLFDQVNIAKTLATDVAFSATEVIMKSPEALKFAELIAPDIPPLGIMDLAAAQIGEMSNETLIALVVAAAVIGYVLMGSDSD
jgi:hypothetical protein